MKNISLILLLTLLAAPASAAPISRIEIEADKTDIDVVHQYLDSRAGDEFDSAKWAADILRLQNTNLFYEVNASTRVENGKIIPRVKLKNKFSFIPIVKYVSGGGTSLVTVGAYQSNFMNRLLEVGGQYENLNGESGAVFWFRHPYIKSWRNHLGGEFYNRTNNLPLLTLDGVEQAFFNDKELRVNGWLRRSLTHWFETGATISAYRNDFKNNSASPEEAAKNDAFVDNNSLQSGRTVSITPVVVLGKLNPEGVAVRGQEIKIDGEWSDKAFGSEFNFFKSQVFWTSGYRLHPELNINTRFSAGTKSGQDFQHKFYLGGLDSIRGFLDGQFRGEHMWMANLEARPTLLKREIWVLQGNLFTDWGKTWDEKTFSTSGAKDPIISYGLGFRVILPRVHRAVLRVDFARTERPTSGFGMNLGLQQFF